MMSHHHRAREDRESIVVGLRVGLSISEMATHLGRHRSTLSREIRRTEVPVPKIPSSPSFEKTSPQTSKGPSSTCSAFRRPFTRTSWVTGRS